ncbi:unnamed protein product [Acanthoscelides obtectus]|uniref:Uncharacterized protein n=1 Tax=Acanthoscelides obtectus TaxID=200917 RepID=A0A9P0M1W7_ACAOB|nr:unnamed protein product [Acanthoscelides obtectus]CAK1622565.1 hypothetical protein AOBTE_LOCUS1566 [Acanthoscelides obtectus]
MNNLSVRSESPQPGPSGIQNPKASPVSPNKSSIPHEVITPGKALKEIMPVPVLSAAVKRVRKKISGEITSEEFIKNKKDAQIKKSSKPVKKTKNKRKLSESSVSEDDVTLDDSSSGDEGFSDLENECVRRKEDYRQTCKQDDWLQCIFCKRWLHETCTGFVNLCNKCGKSVATKKKKS